MVVVHHGLYSRGDIESRDSELYLDRYVSRNCYGVGIYYSYYSAVAVVNQGCYSLNGRSLEVMLTFPLFYIFSDILNFVHVKNIG